MLRLCAVLVATLAVITAPALAEVTTGQERDIYILENEQMRVEVDAAGGARIRSWTLKPSGREMVALWNGAQEDGGALDDRAVFTAQRYDGAITRTGPDVGILRFEASDRSGLSLVKHISLAAGSPTLRITWALSNGTQAERTLWIRNFLLPGTQPQTDAHRYWISAEEPADGAPDAAGYFQATEPNVMALWDEQTGDGVMVHAPGVDRFYLWRGSREHPTFEWIYEPLAPGQEITAEAALVTVEGETTAPDWAALAEEHAADLRGPRLAAVEGWVDEATRFGVTAAERERGFWLSTGDGDHRQRLPEPLELDLPLEETRYVEVTLNSLGNLSAPIAVSVPDEVSEAVTPFLEVPSEIRRELLPIPGEALRITSGSRESLWLRVDSSELAAGTHEAELTLRVGEATVGIPLRLRVWPVKVDVERPFHVRGYSGGFTVWSGEEVTEQNLRNLEAILAKFTDLGGDVFDWAANWPQIIKNVRVAETGELLRDVATNEPERLQIEDMPELDFSYYDPWFELCREYGVLEVQSQVMAADHPQIGWKLLAPLYGADRIEIGSPEAERIVVWFWGEMRRALEERGFTGFFGKVSDEISPEFIPSYIGTAKLVREAGWRPFTTVTGMIARTAEHINAMDPWCDQWQLGFGSKDTFVDLLTTRYEVIEETHELPNDWVQYRNGGAKDTWSIRVFGEGNPVEVSPEQVESFEMLEDGEPMQKKGGSPWGNDQRGTVITGGALHDVLYISPSEGLPAEHTYTLKITVRRPSPDGEPLVEIDDSDVLWTYGGGSHPYRRPYHGGWIYPLLALYHDFDGYALWAFYHWNETERIIWLDQETGEITISPAYCGYRDGWHDALLLAQLQRERGDDALGRIMSEEDGEAPLAIDWSTSEIYRFRTIGNAADPVARNLARRAALQALAGEE